MAAGLGLTASHISAIINMPMEQLSELADERNFDEEQFNVLRDIRWQVWHGQLRRIYWRRRGKNLIAAHNCRHRKLSEVEVRTIAVHLVGRDCYLQELERKVQEAKAKLKKSKEIQKSLLEEKAKLEKVLKNYHQILFPLYEWFR